MNEKSIGVCFRQRFSQTDRSLRLFPFVLLLQLETHADNLTSHLLIFISICYKRSLDLLLGSLYFWLSPPNFKHESFLNWSVFCSAIPEIVAVISDGCCTDPSTLVYTHSSPLTHLHTLCSSVPTSRVFVPWDLGNLYAISEIFSCLGWSLLTALKVQKSWRRSAGGCSRAWNISLLIRSRHGWWKFITPTTRRTHVGPSNGSDYSLHNKLLLKLGSSLSHF